MANTASAVDRVHMSLEEARDLTHRTLAANGADEANATAVTNTIMAAERDICASHGIFRVPGLVASLRSGKVKGDADPKIRQIAPSVLRVDAEGGFAPLALERSRKPLADLARSQGIAVCALVNLYHYAALWPETEALAEDGLCAFAMTCASPMVAPAGGTKPFFGTNPVSFAWPRPGRDPMVFDQASAAMARGDVMIHARDGHEVPLGVGIDAQGNPTTDPNEVLKGAQLPFGGYKGSAIALMVELLAGGLIGEVFSYEAGERDNKDGGPTVGGEFMIAIDPQMLGDADNWPQHCEAFFARLLGQPGEVRLPGDRRHANRKKTATEGISIPKSLHDKVVELSSGP